MKPVLIFGATRGVGLEVAYRLRGRNQPVLALVRPNSETAPLKTLDVEIIPGDATCSGDVERAFMALGTDGIVISTLAGRLDDGTYVDETGNQTVIDVARRYAPERLVLVTAIGCGEMMPYRSEQAIAAFGDVVEAKTRAEDSLRTSGLPYTIIRPGGLLSAPATGRAILSTRPTIHGMITRADVACLIERVIDEHNSLGKAFAAVDLDHSRLDPDPSKDSHAEPLTP